MYLRAVGEGIVFGAFCVKVVKGPQGHSGTTSGEQIGNYRVDAWRQTKLVGNRWILI